MAPSFKGSSIEGWCAGYEEAGPELVIGSRGEGLN
jgi:hypothetical protein